MSYIVEEIEFLAAYFVVLAQSFVSLIHHLTYLLVVACLEGVADCKHAVFFAKYEFSTTIIYFAYLVLNFFEVLPCAIAQSLNLEVWVLCCYVLCYVLTRVATIVVG